MLFALRVWIFDDTASSIYLQMIKEMGQEVEYIEMILSRKSEVALSHVSPNTLQSALTVASSFTFHLPLSIPT